MDLPLLWFVLIAVLWTGYLALEGFDFGVGMLLRTFARDERERRVLLRTIGPVWDGNEVWLLTAGGATFAAFPEWYATMFSGFYLPLLLILLALIVRVCALEWRAKINDQVWRDRWDWALTFGSWLPSILWGVAFANLVQGMEIELVDGTHQLTGGFFSLLTPFTLLGGLVTLGLFLTHGAIFVALKTAGPIHVRAARLAHRLSIGSGIVALVWVLWAQVLHSTTVLTLLPAAVAALSLIGVIAATRRGREGWAFALHTAGIVGAVAFIFTTMFPNVMPSSIDPAFSLSITEAAATGPTLTVMSIVALVFVPVVLGYQGWTYWVFRKRVWVSDIVGDEGLHPTEERSVGTAAGPGTGRR
ncbi:cytochrome bd-I ubiquinol oxidase subunit 2 apoprotein [Georgenia satyanarayanai]|uniref:Cytochrome bd-I ubiquinol oxidase subunit 2 apoprotein n=1 Tax=Georgenia satyanarayanai TaxID=860221 RepID=A0A2Y8ZVG6_9MICO|nr:cytochrome d ubiquinol oxidase subunit II [Georgenia satyanarayanai]PYG01560.1 cytochrome bd-I ubiquinol oxidase subunit 2 apoprotein [Georgenia satyanarayanai]SSA36360.1 cytochrome bd-I ubiquinol oxidase subunit 2 apoprotein [Georgenia satyanarayanai]